MAGEALSKKRSREASLKSCDTDVAPGVSTVPTGETPEENQDLSNDIKGILAALHQVRQKTLSEGQKKSQELLNSATAEIRALIEEAKDKVEKERESLTKQTSKVCKEYETALKDEATRYKTAYAAFCSSKDSHLQAYEDIFIKFEDTKEKLLIKFEQQRKKEKAAYADLQTICTQKIGAAEQLIKKKKQDEKSFHMLRKSLGSILEGSSDEEPDE